jgi:hypothetical protein
MKYLVFDTSTVISLATNYLLWLLEPLKKQFKGEFVISGAIEKELVDDPLHTHRFKFEALIIKDYISEDILKLYKSNRVKERALRLLEIANKIYKAKRHYVRLVQKGEIEGLALAIYLDAEAFAVDERTLRLLIEDPFKLKEILEKKLKTKVEIDEFNLDKFKEQVKKIKIIRSTELAVLAYDLKLLDKYITSKKTLHRNLRKTMLEGVLWGLKLKGCSISVEEIKEILSLKRFE